MTVTNFHRHYLIQYHIPCKQSVSSHPTLEDHFSYSLCFCTGLLPRLFQDHIWIYIIYLQN